MAAAAQRDGDRAVNIPKSDIPQNILKDSTLAHVASAYFSVGKQLERKTQCSATRGFILSALRDGATPNQNQIATQLGLDRTVVHRAIKTMKQEGLVKERRAKTGRAIHVILTPMGKAYRKRLIAARVAADQKLKEQMTAQEQHTLIRLLKVVTDSEL
jgi:DNA-binding MarR family transcriptional regulator